MENSNDRDCQPEALVPSGNNMINAPKFGTVVPNRVFVGGLSSSTTEADLTALFSNYGSVINAKIITDRAGISKGYGFVTFSTIEEAKRIQTDAESIVLCERRLNIAQAIKKQTYHRTYDCSPPLPGSPVSIATGQQLYRPPGVPYFQNGMAFYAPGTHPAQPLTPVQSPVEASGYPSGAYGSIPQNTSAQSITITYPSQNVFYQPHYPYHLSLEGYSLGESQAASSNLVIPGGGAEGGGLLYATATPYLFTQQPGAQCSAYFEPQNMTQSTAATPEQMAPIYFSTSRGYEASSFAYQDHHNAMPAGTPPMQAGMMESNGEGSALQTSQKQGTPDVPQNTNLENGDGAVDGHQITVAKPRGRAYASRGRYSKPLMNNNDPEFANRNPSLNPRPPKPFPTRYIRPLVHSNNRAPQSEPNFPKPPFPNHHDLNHNRPFQKSFHNQPGGRHNRSSPVQVPQFPFFPVRPQYALPQSTNLAPRRGMYRPKYNYRGKTPRGTVGWSKESGDGPTEEGAAALAIALTPPITPRSPQDGSDDLSSSLQGLNIQ